MYHLEALAAQSCPEDATFIIRFPGVMMEVTDEAHDQGLHSRSPACDACKARKTKCDRKSPCSTCETARIPCLTTRRTPERRQRVLLSSKYDSAMENVHRQLQDVAETLKTLVENDKARSQGRTPISPQPLQNSPHDMVDGDAPALHPSSEGYRGDSSFNAHVRNVAEMLETTNANFPASQPAITSTAVHELLLDLRDTKFKTNNRATTPQLPVQAQFQELKDLPLPATEPTLKLLRLITIRKYRFFVDVPIIDEQELIIMCQKVYFAIEPVSSLTWSIVNVGLLYLLYELDYHGRAEIGMSAEDIQANIKQLSANIDVAIQRLKLCLEPSILACKALGLLAMFCIKTGQSSIAWRLITAASRMCLDMGFHRLPTNSKDDKILRKLMLFWYMYALDKGLAFTFGRTPTIHHYDVTSRHPSFPEDFPGIPKIYSGYIEYATIAGEIHQQLFSASSQRETRDVLVGRAKAFISELTRIQDSLRPKVGDTPLEAMFIHASIALDIIMYCLLAVVYRIIPPNNPDAHPLQCCDQCVDSSRRALTILVQVGQKMQNNSPNGWSMLLNLIISLVPFVSFLALIGNTIAISSDSDMALLSSALSVIKPVAENSPAAQNLFEVCQKFYGIAEILTSRGQKIGSKPSHGDPQTGGDAIPCESSNDGRELLAPVDMADFKFPMSQQDWDDVMKDFEMGFGDVNAGEMAMFIEPYM